MTRLVRRPPAAPFEVAWDPAAGQVDAGTLEGFDVVIHLAGENIGSRALDCRAQAAYPGQPGRLHGTVAGLRRPPAALVSASAVGYYGAGERTVDETSAPGAGFLADVVAAWEQAAEPARAAGIRVVHARLGAVLSPAAGLLKRLLPVFRLGAGGVAGDGRQPVSWIGLDDAVGALHFLVCRAQAHGPVNVVAARAATNRELIHALAGVLRRPKMVPVPRTAIRLLFGEMGEQLVLQGQAVAPARLAELGFRWNEPALEGALRWELGMPTEEER